MDAPLCCFEAHFTKGGRGQGETIEERRGKQITGFHSSRSNHKLIMHMVAPPPQPLGMGGPMPPSEQDTFLQVGQPMAYRNGNDAPMVNVVGSVNEQQSFNEAGPVAPGCLCIKVRDAEPTQKASCCCRCYNRIRCIDHLFELGSLITRPGMHCWGIIATKGARTGTATLRL